MSGHARSSWRDERTVRIIDDRDPVGRVDATEFSAAWQMAVADAVTETYNRLRGRVDWDGTRRRLARGSRPHELPELWLRPARGGGEERWRTANRVPQRLRLDPLPGDVPRRQEAEPIPWGRTGTTAGIIGKTGRRTESTRADRQRAC